MLRTCDKGIKNRSTIVKRQLINTMCTSADWKIIASWNRKQSVYKPKWYACNTLAQYTKLKILAALLTTGNHPATWACCISTSTLIKQHIIQVLLKNSSARKRICKTLIKDTLLVVYNNTYSYCVSHVYECEIDHVIITSDITKGLVYLFVMRLLCWVVRTCMSCLQPIIKHINTNRWGCNF